MQSLRLPRGFVIKPSAKFWITSTLAGLMLGLLAEWLAGPAYSLTAKAADLTVGWTLISCGMVSCSRRGIAGFGILLSLAGFAWFLGTLAGSQIGQVAFAGGALLFLHRGLLCQAIICYPAGRPVSWLAKIVVIAGYVYALVVPFARNNVVTLVFTAVLLAAAIREHNQAAGPGRHAKVTAIAGAVTLTVPLAGGSLLRLTEAGTSDDHLVLWSYEAAVILIAIGLCADFVIGRWAQAAVTKLVVDLGDDLETDTLRGRLAHALGDRSLAIAYWLDEVNAYVDEHGNPVELERVGPGRTITNVEHEGRPIAALVHDAAAMDAPGLVSSVAQAARIAMENARLQAEVRNRVAELDASRRRMLEAADNQRLRLQQALSTTAGQRLQRVGHVVGQAAEIARAGMDQESAVRLDKTKEQFDEALASISELAAGIHPTVLTQNGLSAALTVLAARAPLSVELITPTRRLPGDIETSIYFVCAEALTNAAKHAHATLVHLRVEFSGELVTVLIADDGTGGADPAMGSGLRGIADRIDALGGRLVVDSPTGIGTRLVAQIPTRAS
jgi:signal transduction histidine kinase